MSVDPDAVS